MFAEFEKGESREAKFAKAIDALDPIIHELDYKEDWEGWSEEFLKKKKGRFFAEFPCLQRAFEEVLSVLKEEGYFGGAREEGGERTGREAGG